MRKTTFILEVLLWTNRPQNLSQKKQEEILSFCGVAISVKYAEQDDPHIAETLKRSVFSYGFYNNSYKT